MLRFRRSQGQNHPPPGGGLLKRTAVVDSTLGLLDIASTAMDVRAAVFVRDVLSRAIPRVDGTLVHLEGRGRSMLPNRALVAAYVTRHVRLWALLRVGLSGMLFLAGTDPLRVSPPTLGAVVVLAAAVGFVELRLRREIDLLGNLGVGAFALATLVIAPPLAGELLLRAVGALRG